VRGGKTKIVDIAHAGTEIRNQKRTNSATAKPLKKKPEKKSPRLLRRQGGGEEKPVRNRRTERAGKGRKKWETAKHTKDNDGTNRSEDGFDDGPANREHDGRKKMGSHPKTPAKPDCSRKMKYDLQKVGTTVRIARSSLGEKKGLRNHLREFQRPKKVWKRGGGNGQRETR